MEPAPTVQQQPIQTNGEVTNEEENQKEDRLLSLALFGVSSFIGLKLFAVFCLVCCISGFTLFSLFMVFMCTRGSRGEGGDVVYDDDWGWDEGCPPETWVNMRYCVEYDKLQSHKDFFIITREAVSAEECNYLVEVTRDQPTNDYILDRTYFAMTRSSECYLLKFDDFYLNQFDDGEIEDSKNMALWEDLEQASVDSWHCNADCMTGVEAFDYEQETRFEVESCGSYDRKYYSVYSRGTVVC